MYYKQEEFVVENPIKDKQESSFKSRIYYFSTLAENPPKFTFEMQ